MSNIFENDYDLGSLQKIVTNRFGFELYVTPRFTYHYMTQVYEEMTSLFIRQSVKGVKTFIDIGAHKGFFDVLVGRSNSECKFMAFEPVPENWEILKQNLKINNIRAEISQAAASDLTG